MARRWRVSPANSQAPYKISGKAECPPDWPVLAMSNHTSYPAGHPAKPPATAAAVACYQTAAKATSAGYRPAPLPAGTLEVGGVYLTPTSPSFRASCRQAADRLGFAVPCPGLLPTIPPGLPPPKLCQEPSSCRRGELLGFTLGGFVVPADYVGAPGMQPYGGLEIWAAPTAVAASRPPVQCQNERRIATPTVHHTPAVLADCPDAQGRPESRCTPPPRRLDRHSFSFRPAPQPCRSGPIDRGWAVDPYAGQSPALSHTRISFGGGRPGGCRRARRATPRGRRPPARPVGPRPRSARSR